MGGKGSNADNLINSNSGYNTLYNQPQMLQDPKLLDALSNYSSGKSSLSDALTAARGNTDYGKLKDSTTQEYNDMWNKRNSGQMSDQDFNNAQAKWQNDQNDVYKAKDYAAGANDRMNALFSNPLTGTKAATDQVMGNSLYQPYINYGQNLIGQDKTMQGNLSEDRDAMSGKTPDYGLTNNDYIAYGQGSGNIARQFASSDQGLAQSLADRGLAGAPSGIAASSFSNNFGNKNEQLAQLQQQIVQNRISTAGQMAQARMTADVNQQKNIQGSIQGMGQLAGSAIQDQFNRNQVGIGNYQNQLQSSLGAAKDAQNQGNEQFSQQQATKGPGFGDIMMGIGGSAISGGLGAATGGLGSSLGAGLGKNLGGADIFGNKNKSTTNPNAQGPAPDAS